LSYLIGVSIKVGKKYEYSLWLVVILASNLLAAGKTAKILMSCGSKLFIFSLKGSYTV